MRRQTVSLDYDMHRALKKTAARQGRSIGSIIEEGLRLQGIKPIQSARDSVQKVREHAALTDAEAAKMRWKNLEARVLFKVFGQSRYKCPDCRIVLQRSAVEIQREKTKQKQVNQGWSRFGINQHA